MPLTFNPFTGNFDNTSSTLKGDEAYTVIQTNSANWESTYTTVKSNSASFVKTTTTTTFGTSAVSTIIAVSALPLTPDANTLYIVI